MNHDPPTRSDIALLAILLAGSAAAWYYVVSRRIANLPILPYRPRRPVPWGMLDVLVFLLSVWVAIELALSALGQRPEIEGRLSPLALLVFSLAEIGGAGIGLSLIFARYHLSFRSLRWNRRHWVPDLLVGLGAAAAISVPVYFLKLWLTLLFDVEERHPLVRTVLDGGGLAAFWAAAGAAVVAAPLVEETLFRLLLQGWLESAMAGRQDPGPSPEPSEGSPLSAGPNRLPPPRAAPIIITAGLFAAAHWGNGLDPIPLFILGLTLGYVFRQTHRLAPCIIVHAAVNACSMLILWTQLEGRPVP